MKAKTSLTSLTSAQSNKSLDASGGSVFRIMTGSAMLDWFRAAASTLTLGCCSVSEPGAVATGLKIQHLSPAKAGSGFLGDVIPGLRSLRSLTRGYNLSSLRDSLTQTSKLSLCLRHSFSRLDATQQIWTRAAGVRKSNDEGGTMNG